MSNWMRQGRRRARNNTQRSSGPKTKRCFGFRDEIKLGRKPKNLLFLRGDYTSYRGEENLPYWSWLRHKFVDPNKQVKGTNASGAEYSRDFMASFYCTRAGTPDWSGECAACDRNNPRMDPDDRDKRIGTSSVQHWSVVDLDWYYVVTNKWGDTVYEQPSSPAQEKKFIEEGYQKVFGKLGYLAFGPLHATQFDDIVIKSIERMCGGCSYEGYDSQDGGLEPAAFKCESCGSVVEDLATTEWTGDQIEAASYGEADIKCHNCGHVGAAEIEWACIQCTSPTEVDLWECVIPLSKFVSKTENGKTQSSIQLPTRGKIEFATDYRLPNGEELARISDSGELEFNPLVSDKCVPIDFKGSLFATQFDSEYQHGITDGALSNGVTPRPKG